MRRILTIEVLSPTRLQQNEILRLDEANHFLRHLYNQCKQQESMTNIVIDIRLALRYYCGNVIMRMMLGQYVFWRGWKTRGAREGRAGACRGNIYN